MNYVVDVIDMWDRRLAQSVINQLTRHEPGTTIIQAPALLGSLSYVVEQVLKHTTDRSLNVLRFWGHGEAGMQNVSGARYGDRWAYGGSIDINHFDVAGHYLEELKPRFYNAKSRIELRGCRVAAGGDGRRLMLAIAKSVGVRVLAGSDAQADLDWTNAVYQAEPDGTFKQTYYTASAIWRDPDPKKSAA
jgi:hypothetical protein